MAWYTDFGTDKKFRLGTRKRDVDGKEYVYLEGVASTVANEAVVFDESFATTRTVAASVGPVAVSQSACVASNYGWYQIYGNSTVKTDASVATDTQIYVTSTAGDVDDADSSTDAIIGMYATAADDSAAATTAVWLNYPHISPAAID